ncbi:hypothetical protein [Dactylosporangium sp. CA-139066]|uniref:hypothetical protein n=1 Tax=Dactylosporangium sp. CA-139066 TaxID=3239930 RepID=UPI003D8F6B72
MASNWKTIKAETAPDGAYVELRRFDSGKGRTKFQSWKIYRDGRDAGYASIQQDADANYRRVLAGFERNPSTGSYEARPRTIVDTCPVCGFDLKDDGYPEVHQADPDGEHCTFTLILNETDEDA